MAGQSSGRGTEIKDGARLFRLDEMPSLQRGAGARSWMLVDRTVGSTNFTGGVSTFDPGVEVPLHNHNVDEMVTVLHGSGECEVEGETRPVTAMDSTYIPAGVVHCFRNTGSEPMSILWVYGSTDVTRTFAETGQTVQHFSPEDRVGREPATGGSGAHRHAHD